MHDFPIMTTIAVGFTLAWILGAITHRLGLSPIVGYLLAGVAIGPHTPGYVGDVKSAKELAEIGVILLMFGVGLHFHFKDLLAVRSIAVPGAIGQSLLATAAGAIIFKLFGWSMTSGLVLGVSMAVASTVVLMRVLQDADQMDTPHGHAAVGWLIVEDIITVIVLVLIPGLAGGGAAAAVSAAADAQGAAPVASAGGGGNWVVTLGIALAKLAALVAIVVFAGSRFVPRILVAAARLRSRELFTLAVLVLSIAVATASAVFFGASVALGAFLAGMVVGQSPVSQQAGADLLPLRDSFAVLFFVSVGMLFDPAFVVREPLLLLAGLAIVLIVKPLAAIAIVAVLGYPMRTAITVAVGLAQIGEFSFIVSELGTRMGLLPDTAHNVLVATAIISITLNPLLFRQCERIEKLARRVPGLAAMMDRRGASAAAGNAAVHGHGAAGRIDAVIVGYGPAGRNIDRLLREAGVRTSVIELNTDTVGAIREAGGHAVYGDAGQSAILEEAGTASATRLILSMPDAARRTEVILAAQELNPKIRIFARARYARDREFLRNLGVCAAAIDEVESGVELARLVLEETGADSDRTRAEVERIRREFSGTGETVAPAKA